MLGALFAMPVQAQDIPQGPEGNGHPKPSLEGIWQLCTFQKDDKGEVSLHLSPILKTINSDGSYATVITKTTSGGSMIAESGNASKLNDSVIVQVPRASRRMENQQKPDTITFQLKGPQWLVIESKNPEGNTFHEIWMRLRPNPSAKSILDALKKGEEPTEMPNMEPGNKESKRGKMRQRMPFGNNSGGMEMNMGGNDDNGSGNWKNED